MELPDNLALGYIVLVDGQKLINNIIEIGTMSKWSHVAMVLCNPSDITQNPTTSNQQSWYCFESNTIEGDDVHVVAWKDFISFENNSSVAVRPFQYEPGKMANPEFLKSVVNKYLNRHYEIHTSELILAAFRANNREDLGTLFCSELTALVLQDLGLLSDTKLADNYVPADFSLERPNSLKLIGAKLGSEIPVQPIPNGFFGTISNCFTGITRFISQKLGFNS